MTYSLRILLVILASYRIAELIVIDDGPFHVFKRFRSFVGINASRNSFTQEFALFLNCPFCIGVWISFVLSLFVLFPSTVGDILILLVGIAGGQCLLESLSRRE